MGEAVRWLAALPSAIPPRSGPVFFSRAKRFDLPAPGKGERFRLEKKPAELGPGSHPWSENEALPSVNPENKKYTPGPQKIFSLRAKQSSRPKRFKRGKGSASIASAEK